jgi:hypothetical protein
MRTSHRCGVVAGVLLVSLTLLEAEPASAGILGNGSCNVAAQPAATLLIPYFEVDLDDPVGGVTTLFAVSNHASFIGFQLTALARVTLWTDWGVPTLTFDIAMRGRGTQTFNVRDLLGGTLPSTPVGLDISGFTNCAAKPPGGTLTAAQVDTLRNKHSGRAAPTKCLGERHSADGSRRIARGYATVDVVSRCFGLGTTGVISPAWGNFGYFAPAATKTASTANSITGDFFIVDPGNNFANGNEAIHIVADTDRFPDGVDRFTFYGHFVGWQGTDRRAPLPSSWSTRYLNGGVFSGGTDLIVWRDPRTAVAIYGGENCGTRPSWIPIGTDFLRATSEPGSSSTTRDNSTAVFPLATQRKSVGSLMFLPGAFGRLDLDLDDATTGRPRQAAVLPIMDATGRFSVGFDAWRTNDNCSRDPNP